MLESRDIMIRVELGDITKFQGDAIVNAANHYLMGGGGVDGAIHRAAGPRLKDACRKLNGCVTGTAKITDGFQLPVKYIIHTVGPVYHGHPIDAELLGNCYKSALDLAAQYHIESIAFPAISTGIYRYPISEAAEIAAYTVETWLANNPEFNIEVTFICFDHRSFQEYQRWVDNVQLI